MTNKVAIVGNGPARNLYPGTFDGDVCLNNVPQLNVEYNFTSIVDRRCFEYIHKEKLHFPKPILTTNELFELSKKWQFTTEVKPVYELKLMNSATTAAYYFAQTYDEIWLYGCNALWSTEVSSHQDEIIYRHKRRNDLYQQWRTKWEQVWITDKKFVIVCPEGTEGIDYGDNVKWNSPSPLSA